MHMVRLDMPCPNGPALLSTDPTDFLFEKRGNRANKTLFAVCGAPDKVVRQRVGDVFGVLRIHTHQYTRCSRFSVFPCGAALPLDES
ncbi:hypothetical protein KDAU_33430 [Dictyobacter aurantiacus]|uniref:Uncharacterized protein n=1 Tax=Dictyobacter aurantiacus TaxID=1936993 RepID=A0A401ZGK0_9CHLR|nr:hypothetical protein KDAU_33430 [Dictyobacter aurantiacus]